MIIPLHGAKLALKDLAIVCVVSKMARGQSEVGFQLASGGVDPW